MYRLCYRTPIKKQPFTEDKKMNEERNKKLIEELVGVIVDIEDDFPTVERLLRKAGMTEEEIYKYLYNK